MKKGFTLIELLAVIVILAIIALIATPIILNIIKSSKTSSNDPLLSAITPEIVTVCCCAGSSEYTKDTDNMFPTQDFINRVAPYTTKVYVTTEATYTIETNDGKEYLKYNGYKSLNGNIIVSIENNEISLSCSVSNTKLKDTEWFNRKITLNGVTRSMRTWPNVESIYN